MSIGVAEIAAAVRKASAAFELHEAELNAADGQLGDGDTGAMLNRLAKGLAATDLTGKATPAEAFKALAMAASASTGSSLGTLAMTALMNLGKGAADKPSIEIGELAAMLDAAMETVLKRGGAKLGDKTVVDSLAAVIEALRGASESAAAKATASAAAQRALAIFRDQPSRIGRAGRYGDKSRGLDDPGMLAFAILCDSLASD